MKYKLADLLNIPSLQKLLDELDEIYSIPSAIIDMEGNILTGTAWQDICTKFHRVNPKTTIDCIKSDTYIVSELSKGKSQVVYKCPHGLIDTATPITVDGKHLGNAFTGQFFFEPPDEAHYRKLSKEYGFDEESYIEALRKVPIVSKEKHSKNLKILASLTEMLAEMGLQRKSQIEIEVELAQKNKELKKEIEDRNQMEVILHKSNDTFKRVMDSLTAIVYVADMDTYEVLFANKYTKENIGAIEGKTCWESIQVGQSGPCSFCTNYKLLTAEGKPAGDYKWEFQNTVNHHWYYICDRAITWTDGRIVRLEIATDITERKNMEEQIKSSLEEKVVLLQEIHHRVKNNFTVIMSLLKLQSRNIENEEVKAILRDSENRIKSMSLVHEMLYRTENLANINFGEYVKTLTETMLRTYKVSPVKIKVKVSIKDIQLNTDTSITLGLVINELVSNAMKHAFPGDSAGEISIAMKAIEMNNEYEVMIKDNGVGLPEGFDIRDTDTLGLNMVTNMVEGQLSGTIEIKRAGGTEYKIRCKALEYKKRI